MFGFLRNWRNQKQQFIDIANQLQDIRDSLAEKGHVTRRLIHVANENQSTVEKCEELLEEFRGSPFSALHKWISQSTEREAQARSNEKEYVRRWKEHAEALTSQVQLLQKQIASTAHRLVLTLPEELGQQHPTEYMRTMQWPHMLPIGSTFIVTLTDAISIESVVTGYTYKQSQHFYSGSDWLTVHLQAKFEAEVPESVINALGLYWEKSSQPIGVAG